MVSFFADRIDIYCYIFSPFQPKAALGFLNYQVYFMFSNNLLVLA